MATGQSISPGSRTPAITWMARILAAMGVLVCGFAIAGIFGEGGHQPLPFVSKGAPFGTYAQSTQLGILTLGAGFALSFVGALLAFWWTTVAVRLLIAGGLVQTLLWAISLSDSTRPTGDHGILMGLLLFALPPFVTAVLLLGNNSRASWMSVVRGRG